MVGRESRVQCLGTGVEDAGTITCRKALKPHKRDKEEWNYCKGRKVNSRAQVKSWIKDYGLIGTQSDVN